MGYMKIPNLYKKQDILLFKQCYAMEKIHGTSTYIGWWGNSLHIKSGGIDPHEDFVDIFDIETLKTKFNKFGRDYVIIHGEGYGGKCQGEMRDTYGDQYRFVAFDVNIDDMWLSVPDAYDVAHRQFGFDFVDFELIDANMDAINRERNRPSEQARKLNMGDDKLREGIVIRPPMELTKNNGDRVVAKYKNAEFQERQNQPRPKEVDPKRLEKLKNANEIAGEWVTDMRLTHVLDAFSDVTVEDTGEVIKAMQDDVFTEAEGEIEGDKNAIRKAVAKRTAKLLHERLTNIPL